MAEECLFCHMCQRRVPSVGVYEDAEVFAFRDIRPQAPVHIVVVPKQHIARVSELDAATAPVMGRLILAANQIAKQQGLEQGYRLVVNCGRDGGQTVFHLHVHLLGGRPMTWPPG